MDAKELQSAIIQLLSSSRRDDRPQHCRSLTRRQICDLVEEIMGPNQEAEKQKKFKEHIEEQLEVLTQEFEIVKTGDKQSRYCMAPPSLIVSREEPLLADYVGDRAYISLAREVLEINGEDGSTLVGSSKSLDEVRESLEFVGISVQTEEMLFESVPDPVLPTERNLSRAEKFNREDISAVLEVYIPRRAEFTASRWFRSSQSSSSTHSLLYRVKEKGHGSWEKGWLYLWRDGSEYCELTREQALLAMFRIDIERNLPRLLSLDGGISAELMWQLPRAYASLVLRYTVEDSTQGVMNPRGNKGKIDHIRRQRHVRYKYKSLIGALLEGKLGINRSID